MSELSASAGSEGYEACADAVGVDRGGGRPVPNTNTEVKLTRADDTCLVTGR